MPRTVVNSNSDLEVVFHTKIAYKLQIKTGTEKLQGEILLAREVKFFGEHRDNARNLFLCIKILSS